MESLAVVGLLDAIEQLVGRAPGDPSLVATPSRGELSLWPCL